MTTPSLSSRLARAGLLAGLSTLTAGTACVQDQDFLIVDRAVWFEEPDECTLTGDEPTPLSMPVDVSYLNAPIGMAFVVSNLQTPNLRSNTGIDDTEIYVETAEVTLSFSGGGVSGSTFEASVPTNSIPGGDEDVFLVEIPSEVGASLRTTMAGLPPGSVEYLEMEVVFKGRRSGQVAGGKLGAVETRPYTFPFTICHECLGRCLPAEDCGGMAGDPPVCPTSMVWSGVCGFPQGLAVYPPGCELPS
jgi:hypothetical protein